MNKPVKTITIDYELYQAEMKAIKEEAQESGYNLGYEAAKAFTVDMIIDPVDYYGKDWRVKDSKDFIGKDFENCHGFIQLMDKLHPEAIKEIGLAKGRTNG